MDEMFGQKKPDRTPLIKVTGLWATKAKDGRQYYSGTCKEGPFAGYKFIIFQNTYYREGTTQPQMNLCAAEKESKDAGSD